MESLDHRNVFLLDDGMTIMVWHGQQSKLTQQKKATLFAEKINKLERKNEAELVVITRYVTLGTVDKSKTFCLVQFFNGSISFYT